MADFCKQCSIELFGHDSKDLSNMGNRKLTNEELSKGFGWLAVCEGCGEIIVDDNGKCVSKNCLKNHWGENDHPDIILDSLVD